MKKLKLPKFSLRVKTLFLIIVITLVLMAISVTVSYRVHLKTTNAYYTSLVSEIGKSEAAMIDTRIVGEFVTLLETPEYRAVFDEANEAEDEQIIIDYLEEKGLYQDYLSVTAQLEQFRENMGVDDIYLENLHGECSTGLFDPQESILTLGLIIQTEEEFAAYTTNDPIPADVSNGEYGWLCSGYESVIDENGNKIAIVGVDIDMNDIVAQRVSFLHSLLLYLLIYIAAAATLSVFLMRKMVVKPLDMLTDATKAFVNSDDYSLNRIIDLPLNTGDEVEELYVAVKKMESDIINYIENITRINAEKERIGAELNVATQIQADMLPSIFPAFPERTDFDIFASMNPAKEVGGDFYDFFLIDDDHLAMVMADVSGKGVPAALFMVIAKTLIKNRAQMGGSPAEILSYVNEQLCEGNEAELFVTVWLAILELSTGKGVAANAGHEYPTLRRAGGQYELVKTKHSPAVATMEGLKFREREFTMQPGDSLYVYTDGVPEATNNASELFGTERMLHALNRNPDAPPEEILRIVRDEIDAFVGDAPQFDDVTMLCLKFFGKGGE